MDQLDDMYQVYCPDCRKPIDLDLSNQQTYCDACLQARLPKPPVIRDTHMGVCSACGSRNISQRTTGEGAGCLFIAFGTLLSAIGIVIMPLLILGVGLIIAGFVMRRPPSVTRTCKSCGHAWTV